VLALLAEADCNLEIDLQTTARPLAVATCPNKVSYTYTEFLCVEMVQRVD